MAKSEDDRALPFDRLSAAEERVARLLLEGQTNREIAQTLVLSEATVRTHLRRIYVKLGVRGRRDLLARIAARNGDHRRPVPSAVDDDPPPGPVAPTSAVAASLSLAAVGLAAAVFVPKATAFFGPLLVLVGVQLDLHPGDRVGRWVRLGSILLGLALWALALWLIAGGRES
jgi:DNA-binding CsgD family transcriptional regulator